MKELGRKKCPICKKLSVYRFQAGGWYCPKHKWFFPSDLRRNPGTKWHVDRANDLRGQIRSASSNLSRQKLYSRIDENITAANASRHLGMNPKRKNPIIRRQKRFSLIRLALLGGIGYGIYYLIKRA